MFTNSYLSLKLGILRPLRRKFHGPIYVESISKATFSIDLEVSYKIVRKHTYPIDIHFREPELNIREVYIERGGGEVTPRMWDYLPPYYGPVTEFKEIIQAESVLKNQLHNDIEDMRDQAFVDSATWGLEKWEKDLGLQTNISLPLGIRRGIIKSTLRNHRKCDKEKIENYVKSFVPSSQIEVSFLNSNINIIIKTMDDTLTESEVEFGEGLEKMIPSHLSFTYSITALAGPTPVFGSIVLGRKSLYKKKY